MCCDGDSETRVVVVPADLHGSPLLELLPGGRPRGIFRTTSPRDGPHHEASEHGIAARRGDTRRGELLPPRAVRGLVATYVLGSNCRDLGARRGKLSSHVSLVCLLIFWKPRPWPWLLQDEDEEETVVDLDTDEYQEL